MNPLHNALLADLPSEDYQTLHPLLSLVSLQRGETLFEAGQIPSHVYFPVGAIVSMINDLPDGQSIELHMMGRTCLVGAGAIDSPSFYRATVRRSGLAYRLLLGELKSLRVRSPAYFVAAQTRTSLLMSHIAQRATCIKHHTVEQQLVRWMMLMLDRQFENVIGVTHTELAALMGNRREAVTLALGHLARQGLLVLGRGAIQIPDRAAIELVSCDCYWNALGKPSPGYG